MRTSLLLAVVVFLAVPLAAQRQTLTLDVGFVNASGNSDFTSASLGEKATWGVSGWGLTQTAKVLFGETEGTRTTESYDVNLRAERALSPRIGAFVFGAYQRDPFAGLSSRWSGGPGIAVGLIRSARDTLGVESAITQQSERTTAAVHRSFGAMRTAALFKHSFATAASVSQALEWVANLETSADYRLNSETALIAPLSRKIGLRVSYLIRFDSEPEPGFKKSDRILTTGIQVAL